MKEKGQLFKNYPHLKTTGIVALSLFLAPLFITNDYYFATAILFIINMLLIVSMMVVIGYAGQISLAHAAIFGIGAYTSAYLTTKLNLPFLLAFVFASLAGLVFSILIGAPSIRLSGHYLAMATLGFGEIIYILFQELHEVTGGVNGFTGIRPAEIFGYQFVSLPDYYWFVAVLGVLILLFLALLVDSKAGRALRAIKSSEVAAKALGINPVFFKLLAFGIAGAVAGACGSLYAHLDRFIAPSVFTVSLSVMIVAMVIVGGENSFSGAIFSALLFSLLSEYVRQFQELSQLLFGVGLLVISVYLKSGLPDFKKIFMKWVPKGSLDENPGS